MKFAVNMLTLNGATSFIQEAIGAVYDFCDEIRVFDTGSTDRTVNFIEYKFPKVKVSRYKIQHLGETWTGSDKDKVLTSLLNELKIKTKEKWILKIDDDEIFPKCLLQELSDLSPKENDYIYSIPFVHVGGKKNKKHYIKRFFRNSQEVTWNGIYGIETLALNGSRISSQKCPSIRNHFYHLGGLSPAIKGREHDYTQF